MLDPLKIILNCCIRSICINKWNVLFFQFSILHVLFLLPETHAQTNQLIYPIHKLSFNTISISEYALVHYDDKAKLSEDEVTNHVFIPLKEYNFKSNIWKDNGNYWIRKQDL